MRWGAVLGVCALAASLATSAAGEDDGSSREWNQSRGNAARTACVDVAPIRAAPQIAWTWNLPGEVVSSPVAWEGVVFLATKNAKGEATLSAVRAATGELIVERALGKAEWVDVAVLRGNVILVDPGLTRCLRFDGTQFSQGWNLKGDWAGLPAIVHGTLLLADAKCVHLLDPATGRDALPPVLVNSSVAPSDFAATCAADNVGGDVRIGRLAGGTRVPSVSVQGLGTRSPAVGDERIAESPFRAGARREGLDPRGATLVQFGRRWFATYESGFFWSGDETTSGSILLDGTGRGDLMPVNLPVAVVGTAAYGMSSAGAAYAFNSAGSYVELTRPGNLPKGAGVASASASRGVVYFGNWAMEIASGRVLWCLPDVAPVTPLVPVGDGRGVVVDRSNRLLGIAEPGAPTSAPTTADATSGGDDLPGDADGVLLCDGRFVAGDAKLAADGRVKLTPSNGDAQDLAPGAWTLAQRGGKAVASNEERRVLAALQDLLDRRSTTAWETAYRRYADVPLVADALRVLAAAKRDGLSDDRARKLEQLVAGKRDHPNADLQRKRMALEERKLRDGYLDDVRAASQWCRARGLVGAAAALLVRVRAERPDDATLESVARELLPPGFPWAARADAGVLWIEWATQIVPAGGTFVAPDAPETKAKRAAPWDADVILLRTRNVLLVSRSSDPLVVGACLRHAEGAIRACERVLGPASSAAAERVMEVRLHRDRAAYLAEVTPSGYRAEEWSIGNYSPSERVSRFCVPGVDSKSRRPLVRQLLSILAHEVTHQWIDLRWAPGGGSVDASRGFWCVEGVARFIEDQSVEMGRREGRLDDPTVASLDVTSQIDAGGALLPLADLLAMSQSAFALLKEDPKVEVRMRNTAGVTSVGPLLLFYHQSGALVFWLVNQRGAAGRAAFADYLRRRYRGDAPADAATALGFASGEEMEREFRKFLAGLRQ